MPRLLTLLLVIMAVLFAPRQAKAATTGELAAPGVSKALAEYRRATISDLRYVLSFAIPSERTDAVAGEETVSFSLTEPSELIFDFRASDDQLLAVSVNGSRCDYTFAAEHIIIPAASTRSGQNSVNIRFVAGDQSLNRRDDLLYTLFVPDRARTAFPCFDQPDLKALYTLRLRVPQGWRAVSNTTPQPQDADGTIRFAETEPLPTYLFAFAAGKFDYQQQTLADGRTIGAYYRETDPKRVAQLPEIFRQVEHSLRWQEEFTAVPYPFAKYDLVILPGFQFGGMEHTGATFYNANTIFLSENPTPDEILSRASLIAHETSHMWFGDYVTMRWFDDVWTKEVFANYFAAEITAPLFPDVNHDLNRLKTYFASAMSEDRPWPTPLVLAGGDTIRGGGTSIQQELDNLRNAGLVYNNIIYNKSPLVMYKLVELMGRDAFREGIREYVSTYAYGNATWDDLIAILSRHSTADLRAFSHSWVKERGCPEIELSLQRAELSQHPAEPSLQRAEFNQHPAEPRQHPASAAQSEQGGAAEALVLRAVQHDPHQRGLTWPQSFDVRLLSAAADTTVTVTFPTNAASVEVPLPNHLSDAQILPNVDGRGYGIFLLPHDQLQGLLPNWQRLTRGTARQAMLMNLEENYLLGRVSADTWLQTLVAALAIESDPLTASTISRYMADPLVRTGSAEAESLLRTLAGAHRLPSVRTQIVRLLAHYGTTAETTRWIMELWQAGASPLLSERDWMSLSYELALRRPDEASAILATQRARLTDPDRLREFDFVSRAVSPDADVRRQLSGDFHSAAGRRVEPWTAAALALRHHPLRDKESAAEIPHLLSLLGEVQRTGDIFFPANWCRALLGDHISPEARQAVTAFLEANRDQNPLLRAKILNAAYSLFR